MLVLQLSSLVFGQAFEGKNFNPNQLIPMENFQGNIDSNPLGQKMRKSIAYHSLTFSDDGNREVGYDPQKAGQGKRQLLGAANLYKKCVKSVVLLVALDATSLGSGSFIDDSGNIITNWHVVVDHDEMLVWTHDASIAQLADLNPDNAKLAKVIAVDPDRDLALLKLEKEGVSPPNVSLASTNPVSIADDVFSIGHPEGYIWSFTYGVVSQIRPGFSWKYQNNNSFSADVIQTQTPINPGNSGGPLFNKSGQLVGVNSFSYEGQGLNFAVHVNEIRDFVSSVKKGKYRNLSKNKSSSDDVWEPLDLNENGVPDAYRTSANNDDYYDVLMIDEDENGVTDFFAFDTNHDGNIDIYVFDEDDVEGFEHFYYDYDGDGEIDEHGIDLDGDGKPESRDPYEG
jgi:S1-C subfamily serine protease